MCEKRKEVDGCGEEALRFAYAEDGCSAIGADALHGRFAVLERDVLGILDLDVCFAFHTVGLWHFSFN